MAPPVLRQRIGVVTGNIVLVKLNGGTVGIVQNVGFQEGFGHQPVTGLGRVNAYEHAPGAARFSLSLDTFILRKTAIINADIAALGGKNLEDSGLVPATAKDVLKGLVFDIAVTEVVDGVSKTLWTWQDCSYDGGNLSMRKHDILSRSCQMLAIDRVYGDAVVATATAS